MNVSEFLGKIAESADGKRGYVISVNTYDGGKIYLKCADENEREFSVDFKDAIYTGDKILFTVSNTCLPLAKSLRLGTAAVDENGTYIGVIEDFSIKEGKISKIKIGKKNYPAECVTLGDVAIIRRVERIKSDVKKNGRIILKKGTCLTDETLAAAQDAGEYVQTKLKTL